MGAVRKPNPVTLLVAAFSRHPEALEWARRRLEERFGPVALASEPFAFDHTAYYSATMGEGLAKVIWVFSRIDPSELPSIKVWTNSLEEEAVGRWPEARPVNLDPGYLDLGKLVLATTKDQAHRLHLAEGVFAEVTLHWQAGEWRPWPWTYADYREPLVLGFLAEAREKHKRGR